MSATMELLKGGKGAAKAKPKTDPVDEELSADEVQVDTTDKDEEQDADAGTEAEQDEGQSVEQSIAAEEEDQSTPGVAIPTSKTEVHALKLADLPGVHEAMGSPIAGFDDLDLKGKKQALLNHLFPKGGKAKSVAVDDQLTKVSQEIEGLKTRADVEAQLTQLLSAEGETAFRIGGLLVKLSEIGDFGEHANLKDYIAANGIAKDYRTARYWMQLYTGLLEIGVPYADVESIGWTKILVLMPVLTKENVEEWKEKALAVNVATLKSLVDAELNTGGGGGASQDSGPSEIKSMVFKFHKDQTDTANDALAKAKKIANTEVKEVAADLIFTEYLANAPNKSSKKKEAEPAPAAAGYDPENVDVVAFFDAVKERFPDTKEAMGFLFADAADDLQPELAEGEDPKSYFELLWPEVDININVP
jgi:hypothetical protein